MRFLTVAFAALIATLSVSAATARECELTSARTTLQKITQNPSVTQCGAASGVSFNPPPPKPTAAQLDAICAASACQAAVLSLSAMDMPSCTISMFNGINLREIVDAIAAHCQARAAANASGTVSGKPLQQSPPSSSAGAPAAGATSPAPINAAPTGKASLRKNCHS